MKIRFGKPTVNDFKGYVWVTKMKTLNGGLLIEKRQLYLYFLFGKHWTENKIIEYALYEQDVLKHNVEQVEIIPSLLFPFISQKL